MFFTMTIVPRLRIEKRDKHVGILLDDKVSWNKQHLPHRVPAELRAMEKASFGGQGRTVEEWQQSGWGSSG
jgi:hypothetical protein